MLMFRRLMAGLLLTGAALANAAPQAPAGHTLARADLEAWLDGFMPYALERADVAGAVVSVVKDGEILLAKGYGYADVGRKTPVDPQRTLFRPGSVSKLFTWTAVMQLVEQGRLDLDRDVNEYLDFTIPARNDGPITLRHLLTHTPGFEERVKSLIVADAKHFVPLATYVKRGAPTRIYRAGSTPAYSNYGTALAGYIVERVSGQSFDDYVDGHVFQPLGMSHATFRQPLPAALARDMAQGYALASEPPKPYEFVVAAPAGSLAASGVDMARFMIAHLEGGAYQGGRILSAETARRMHETPLTIIRPLNRMLLGFYEQNYNGHRVVSHGGDTQYMHSYLHLLIDDHVGLFVSVNSVGREGAAGAIRSALFDQFLDRYFPGPAVPAGRVDPQTAAAHAQLLAGYYEGTRRAATSFVNVASLLGAVTVEAADDGTVTVSLLKGRNGVVRHYREVEPFVWRDVHSGWRIAAEVVDGRVRRLSADEVSPAMVFEPYPAWRSPAWLWPAAGASLVALLLTALLWPVAALVRRSLGVTPALTVRAARGRLISRIAAVVVTAMAGAWLALFVAVTGDTSILTPALDPWLILLAVLTLIGLPGAAVALLWSAYVAWTARRPWTARLWTAVLALAALVIAYTAWAYQLMSFNTQY